MITYTGFLVFRKEGGSHSWSSFWLFLALEWPFMFSKETSLSRQSMMNLKNGLQNNKMDSEQESLLH